MKRESSSARQARLQREARRHEGPLRSLWRKLTPQQQRYVMRVADGKPEDDFGFRPTEIDQLHRFMSGWRMPENSLSGNGWQRVTGFDHLDDEEREEFLDWVHTVTPHRGFGFAATWETVRTPYEKEQGEVGTALE